MRSKWTPVFILMALGAVMALFQNCSNAVPFGDTDYFMSLVNSSEFPYEVRVDQVAYMSCSEQEDVPNDGSLFTFRVGAFYPGSGIRITQSYRDHIEKVDDDDVPFALQDSRAIGGVRLQFGIRTIENLQLIYLDQDNGAEGLDGYDFANFFPEMNDEALINLLWKDKSGSYLRTYPEAQFIEDYRFAGEVQFMKSQVMEYDLRNFLQDKGLLTLTFAEFDKINPLGPGSFVDSGFNSSGSGLNTGGAVVDSGGSGNFQGGTSNVSSPGSGSPSSGTGSVQKVTKSSAGSTNLYRNVYGVGLKPRFKQPSIVANPGADMPPRVLSEIQEVRIDDRLSTADLRPWSCPSSMQFTIVLPEDASFVADDVTVTRCETLEDPADPSLELQIIRQSLPVQDWYVDMNNRCIVPRNPSVAQGTCYGKDGNRQLTHDINYDAFASKGCGFGNDEGLCPHYASICIRQ